MTLLLDRRRHAAGPNSETPVGATRRWGKRRRRPLLFAVLLVISVIMLLPFVTLAIKALTPAAEMSKDSWLPSTFRWANVEDALHQIPFFRYARNSTFLATVFAALSSLSSALVGYGFARLAGPGKRMLFGVLIAMMIVPQIVTLVPTYLLFAQFGLVGTYWPWVLWGLSSAPYTVFLYRQFYASFPKELEEAARLDGANRLRIFISIFLPLSKPLLVTSFVIAFNATWGDYVAPTLLLNENNTTLAVGVSSGYVNQHQIPLTNLLASGSLMYLLPVVALFLVAQRSYVRGFVNSGLK